MPFHPLQRLQVADPEAIERSRTEAELRRRMAGTGGSRPPSPESPRVVMR